jgi:ribonuclease HII
LKHTKEVLIIFRMTEVPTTKRGLKAWFDADTEVIAGCDECARGCLFGRTYTAAVVWDNQFLADVIYCEDPDSIKEYSWLHEIRDSKKLSAKKREELSHLIKQHCLAYKIKWADEKEIDQKNILNAVQDGFHRCIRELPMIPDRLLVDGNIFKAYYRDDMEILPHVCVEKGDDKYIAIASASILAKVAHDKYIKRLCGKHPELDERYGIASNMGYGAKKHMDGIQEFGVTTWHRKSFKPCQQQI